MFDRVGRKVGGGGVLVIQCRHEGFGTREPVVVVYAFVSSSTRAEPCSLGQGSWRKPTFIDSLRIMASL